MIAANIGGHRYQFDDEDESSKVGDGGEADVFRFNPIRSFIERHGNIAYVVKLFREDTEEQRRAARERQTKLPNFPTGLPKNVVKPVELATDPTTGKIIGYVMALVPDVTPLIEFITSKYRAPNSPSYVTMPQIAKVLTNLHDLLSAVHKAGVVVGDFNDKNILVDKNFEVYLIDADSMQYGTWLSQAYVGGFIDPLICEKPQPADRKSYTSLVKANPHSALTDWYAFTVMAFQLFVLVHPCTGGGYHPQKGEGPRYKGTQRIHRRISVFHPRVGMPEGATPLATLPDTLVRCFAATFTEDRRQVFPRELLANFAWMTCPTCNTQHGRPKCPKCGATGVAVANAETFRNGSVTATRIFRAPQPIVGAAYQGDAARYVYYSDGAYRREDGTIVLSTRVIERIQAYVAGSRTVLAQNNGFLVIGPNGTRVHHNTQVTFGRTTVAANERFVYWIDESRLVRDTPSGIFTIGTVAKNRTQVWVGEHFGVTLCRAGLLTHAQVFDATQPGVKFVRLRRTDNTPLTGRIVDASCVFDNRLAWLTITVVERRGQDDVAVNYCYVLDAAGRLCASSVAYRGSSNAWLGRIHGKAAQNNTLLSVTDKGIAQVGIVGGRIVEQRVISDALPFIVPRLTKLCSTPRGILTVTSSQVLQITES